MSLNVEMREYPSCVESHAGRLFYGSNHRVYFSNVFVDDVESLAKCYQKNDPTSTEFPDILPDDGGEILIQGAGRVLALKEFWKGLLVFSTRGIWYISGGEQGFSALSYRVDKVNAVRIMGTNSVVSFEGNVFFGAESGIHVVSVNENGNIVVQNITETNINTAYEEFVYHSTEGIRGKQVGAAADHEKKEIYFYNPFNQRELVYNARVGAWYPQKYSIPTDDASLGSIVHTLKKGTIHLTRDEGAKSLSFLQSSCSSFKDLDEDYSSYIVSQPETLGSFARKKSAPNIVTVMRRTEENIVGYEDSKYVVDKPSSCFMTIRFDLTDDNARNTWTRSKQIYRAVPLNYIAKSIPEALLPGDNLVKFRDIIRGSGELIQMKFESEGGKDMQLLGYSTEYSMRGRQ